MGRPTDWQPLADSDPVPGDPAGIRAEAAHLMNVAHEIASQVAVLRRIAAGYTDEKGRHIDKLKAAAADTAGQLDKVTGRYQQTAAALAAWVPELEHAQAQSLKALFQARDAAARQQASQPVQRPPGTKLTPADRQADHTRAQALQAADGELLAAQNLLNDAVNHRDEKAGETASRIASAAATGADHWWQSLWDDIKSAADRYAWLIKDVCTVLEVVATVLAIVALLIPGLDILVAIGMGLTALALLGRTMLAATGNGSWLDVGLDVFALLTFGLGKIAGSMLKGATSAAETAAQTASRSQLLDEAKPALNAFRSLISHDGSEALNSLSRAGIKLIYQSIAQDAKLPEFAKLGENGIRAALKPEAIAQGLKTFLPRVTAGGDELARTSAQALSYAGEHFPQLDNSAGRVALNFYRLNFGAGSSLPMLAQVAGGLELDGPAGPTPVNWHIPVVGDFYASKLDGSWTTTAGGL